MSKAVERWVKIGMVFMVIVITGNIYRAEILGEEVEQISKCEVLEGK